MDSYCLLIGMISWKSGQFSIRIRQKWMPCKLNTTHLHTLKNRFHILKETLPRSYFCGFRPRHQSKASSKILYILSKLMTENAKEKTRDPRKCALWWKNNNKKFLMKENTKEEKGAQSSKWKLITNYRFCNSHCSDDCKLGF